MVDPTQPCWTLDAAPELLDGQVGNERLTYSSPQYQVWHLAAEREVGKVSATVTPI